MTAHPSLLEYFLPGKNSSITRDRWGERIWVSSGDLVYGMVSAFTNSEFYSCDFLHDCKIKSIVVRGWRTYLWLEYLFYNIFVHSITMVYILKTVSLVDYTWYKNKQTGKSSSWNKGPRIESHTEQTKSSSPNKTIEIETREEKSGRCRCWAFSGPKVEPTSDI